MPLFCFLEAESDTWKSVYVVTHGLTTAYENRARRGLNPEVVFRLCRLTTAEERGASVFLNMMCWLRVDNPVATRFPMPSSLFPFEGQKPWARCDLRRLSPAHLWTGLYQAPCLWRDKPCRVGVLAIICLSSPTARW